MHRQEILPLVLILTAFCIVVGGCTQGLGTYGRNVTPMTQPAYQAQQSYSNQPKTEPVAAPTQKSGEVVKNLAPCPEGVSLTIREPAQHTMGKNSSNAIQVAQFTEVPEPPAERPVQSAQAAETAKPASAPAAHSTKAAKPAAKTVPLPNLLDRVVGMLGNPPPPPPEVVPVPKAVPAAQQPSVPASAVVPAGGSSITLHVDNLDVRKALEMVSRQAKMNILVSPGVTGSLTLDLRDKSVDETLQVMANLCHLVVRREKDVLYVSTPAEVRSNEEDDLPVRVYHLNYVKSSDIQTMIRPLLSKKGVFTASPDCEMGLMSDASQAGDKAKEVKAGGNTMAGGEIVVVQDYENVLKMIDRVIAQIDVQPVQVLIEAVIVEVKLDKGMELGVNFSLLDGAGRAVGVLGDGAAINAAAGFSPASVLAAGNTGLLKGTPLSGTAEAVPGLKFGFVNKSTTGFIRALETFGETKVLASPRLLVLNKQRAEIHLGDRLGYATTTQTQTSTVQTVQFQDVGTQLRLRPFVSSDGMVRLEIHPERSSGLIDSAGIPQVNAAQVTTNMMVPDGSTIVIGGLIESEVTQKWAGVPFLSRLPWIGYLFRGTEDDTKKKELVVILTPHIWRPQCPEALNYLGRPRTLGLDSRTAQIPCEEKRDGPSLYELTRPTTPCPENNLVPAEPTPLETGRANSTTPRVK